MLKLGYQGSSGRNRRRRKKSITMSKTSEFGSAIDSEHLSELTEEELEQSFAEGRTHLKGFLYWDYKFFRPFFIRKFTQQELKDGKSHVTKLTDKWFHDIQASPLISDLSDSEVELNLH